MAFSVSAFQAALNACTNVEEWQALTSSIDIPGELFPDVYSRLLDLSFSRHGISSKLHYITNIKTF